MRLNTKDPGKNANRIVALLATFWSAYSRTRAHTPIVAVRPVMLEIAVPAENWDIPVSPEGPRMRRGSPGKKASVLASTCPWNTVRWVGYPLPEARRYHTLSQR